MNPRDVLYLKCSDADKLLIGAILIDPDQRENVLHSIAPGDLETPAGRACLAAILDLTARRKPIDTKTLEVALSGDWQRIGGLAFLLDCIKVAGDVIPTVDPVACAQGARECADRLRLFDSFHDGLKALTSGGDVEASINGVMGRLQRIKAAHANEQLFSLLSADAILQTEWPEPVWAVPGLLPVGLTILAGRPKVGKSWLALQIAQAVAAGGFALGAKVERGPILYLALEDPPRRLRERMSKQNWPAGLSADFMPLGQFQTQVGDLRNGGGEKLASQIEERHYHVVIVDTLSRTIPGDQNDTGDMTRGLTPLQEIAHAHNCAIVLVDHHRKGNGFDADVVADILGSTAKGAMCDTAWGLYRERGKAGAKLAITGREVEEKTLALKMDWLTGVWQVEGDAGDLEMTEKRQELLDALSSLGRATLTELVEATGRNKGTVYRDLQDLVISGLVKQTTGKRGAVYCCLPDDDR